ncbi:MAG TPA: hypothetical protein DHW83_02000, partial [Bacteroidales bacterium]|nr:hypothetical protein [Bacteroidales bacterium]
WQVILDLVCDISEYLNTDVSQNEQKSNKAVEDNRVKEQNEDNLTDFETIKNLMNESEKLKKTSDEELNIMRSFLNSLTDNEE